MPYLGFGEQGALWDPTLRGSIGQLTLAHTRADIARALLEGVALEVRRCVRVLDGARIPPGPLTVAGGAAGSEMFAGMLAGATGSAVIRIEHGRWISARGAAIVAAASIGAIDPRTLAPPSGPTLRAAFRRRCGVGRARGAARGASAPHTPTRVTRLTHRAPARCASRPAGGATTLA